MACISCNTLNTTITYNSLKYCKKCFDQMKNMFNIYSNNVIRDKTYDPPVQITDNVYIGNINSVDPKKLRELDINHIIIAGKNLINENHNDFNILELIMDDSFEQDLISNVKLANYYIKSIGSSKVLIHCYSGISRSGSILIGYLMEVNNMTYNEAYSFVKKIYPKVFPNENFQNQLTNLEC